MTSILTNGRQSEQRTAVSFQLGTLLTQAAQQGCHVSGTVWHRYVETRKAARLSLHQVVARCRGWIGGVVRCCPLRAARRMEIMITNQGIDIWRRSVDVSCTYSAAVTPQGSV